MKLNTPQFFGLIIDQEENTLTYVTQDGNKYLGYSNLPKEVHIFICIANAIIITFTRHIVGRSSIEKYLENPQPHRKQYKPSDWVKEHMDL